MVMVADMETNGFVIGYCSCHLPVVSQCIIWWRHLSTYAMVSISKALTMWNPPISKPAGTLSALLRELARTRKRNRKTKNELRGTAWKKRRINKPKKRRNVDNGLWYEVKGFLSRQTVLYNLVSNLLAGHRARNDRVLLEKWTSFVQQHHDIKSFTGTLYIHCAGCLSFGFWQHADGHNAYILQ